MAGLDLSALDDFVMSSASNSSPDGEPLLIEIAQVIEDPSQPRFVFDDAALKELTEDIKLRGVMQAILVRPANEQGLYQIIQGARRYRASMLAGMAHVPCVIKRDLAVFDDYSQVAENKKRADLTPLELARFIEKRIGLGDKKGAIAKQLGIDSAAITQHLAIVQSPPLFLELYQSGRCVSPFVIYKLVKLHESYPTEVEKFCRESTDFRIPRVSAFADALLSLADVSDSAPDASPDVSSVTPGQASIEPVVSGDAVRVVKKTKRDVKLPTLMGRFAGEDVTVLLNEVPSKTGYVLIRFVSNKQTKEVTIDAISGLCLAV
ncbi:ParB/RepB/Spo0J family partition protein (plasmid) [Ampullimonas aquatilis]|uniref:ParB/RepB/Spo0J family partition protein n=1 Tax=Ampullimonas aquatilis TaxID=1341549 RepID=UPI003C7813C8